MTPLWREDILLILNLFDSFIEIKFVYFISFNVYDPVWLIKFVFCSCEKSTIR